MHFIKFQYYLFLEFYQNQYSCDSVWIIQLFCCQKKTSRTSRWEYASSFHRVSALCSFKNPGQLSAPIRKMWSSSYQTSLLRDGFSSFQFWRKKRIFPDNWLNTRRDCSGIIELSRIEGTVLHDEANFLIP